MDGLPKYRPIISQIGSATYKVAKFLLPLITPVTTNTFTIKDSFHFASILDNESHHLYYMASMDVDSLFTNIPLEETIEIILNAVYGKKRKLNGISKADFKELLRLTTMGTVFYFNGMYFRQKDGVAMGSLLGPALSNAFLCFYEVNWLKMCPPAFSPVLYSRYVDDIFILLHSADHLTPLVNYFNTKHKNINFTFECEKDDMLSFLDVNVYRSDNKLVTSIHRKDTFSGVYTNFNSFIPIEYKCGLVLTLLHRAFVITSSFKGISDEILKLKEILYSNGYPSKFVDRYILMFFNKLHEKRIPVLTVPKKDIVIVLPFLGSISLLVKKNLIQTFSQFVPTFKLKVVFRTGNRLTSYFTFKDVFPKSLISGVVYQYKCAKCNFGYIGSTYRYFEKRLEEHLHVSALTGKPLSGLQTYAPMDHAKSCRVTNSRDNFNIICDEKDRDLIRLKENILIYKLRPELNSKMESVDLKLFSF